jgi:hypothetical protein
LSVNTSKTNIKKNKKTKRQKEGAALLLPPLELVLVFLPLLLLLFLLLLLPPPFPLLLLLQVWLLVLVLVLVVLLLLPLLLILSRCTCPRSFIAPCAHSYHSLALVHTTPLRLFVLPLHLFIPSACSYPHSTWIRLVLVRTLTLLTSVWRSFVLFGDCSYHLVLVFTLLGLFVPSWAWLCPLLDTTIPIK